MKQVTIRIPAVGYDRLMRLCERYGVSIRSLFEAATIISLEDEADPERRDSQVNMWALAGLLEKSKDYRKSRDQRVVVSMEDDVHARFAAASRRFGVTQNAALALVVMPWPEETAEVDIRYRRSNLTRIIDRARQLDFQRRGGFRGA